MRAVLKVSDPPILTAEDILRLDEEGRRLRKAFDERTKKMEILTSDDDRIVVR